MADIIVQTVKASGTARGQHPSVVESRDTKTIIKSPKQLSKEERLGKRLRDNLQRRQQQS